MKRVISIIVIIAFVTTMLWMFNPFAPTSVVLAEDARRGFSLTPSISDSTGIDINTTFVLSSQKDLDLSKIVGAITIDGEEAPKVELVKDNTFLIKPSKSLVKNRLYTVRLKEESKKDITWTFQTMLDFNIIGSLPGDSSTYVPINTGIEIYFTHNEYSDISKYFEISPSVQGRFETFDHMTVFIPKELQYGTIYTVTIKNGLPLKDSKQSLSKDYSFSFETEVKSDANSPEQSIGNFWFNSFLNDAAPQDDIRIPLQFYLNGREQKNIDIDAKVYRFNNENEFSKILESNEEIPIWATYSRGKNLIKTNNLKEVLAFTQAFDLRSYDERYLLLPEKLENGFYLVEGSYKELRFQALLQVTNTTAYYSMSSEKTILWVNSSLTSSPIKDAEITFLENGNKYKTNNEGVAYIDTVQKKEDDYRTYYIKISSVDGTLFIPDSLYYNRYGYYNSRNNFWKFVQTDRTIYKPDDYVSFWGFVKGRYSDIKSKTVTVEISEGHFWFGEVRFLSYFLPHIGKPLISNSFALDNGFFEGDFKLPMLSAGSYQVNVKLDDEVITSKYISVEDYVKPAYKMEISKDKEAVFNGESVEFTIETKFFEGTPAANLDIEYNIYGYGSNMNGTGKTDSKGVLKVKYTPNILGNAQGEVHASINARAQLPESGMISASQHLRVFVNDITASSKATIVDNKGEFKVTVNSITLDRINTGKAEHYSDYLDKPVTDKLITGSLVKHTWIKYEDGEYYDYINKLVQKRYRYEEKRDIIEAFEISTDENGEATKVFENLDASEGYYNIEFMLNDSNGRTMNYNAYLSKQYNYTYNPYSYDNRYYFEANAEKYRLENSVELVFMHGENTLPEKMNYLYIEAQDGIKGYKYSTYPSFVSMFEEKHIPNYYITGVYFNGKTYIESEQLNLIYDYDERRLTLTATTDKNTYKPGETCNISIKAVDENGKPVKAKINLSLVDEALLALSGNYVDVMQELYTFVDSGILSTYSSHSNRGSRNVYYGGRSKLETAGMISFSENLDTSAYKLPAAANDSFSSVTVRDDFKDTALFKTVNTDENGGALVSFTLPDNITSWDITLAGISNSLYGGTGKTSLKVSLPFFVNYAMNSTCLVNDIPSIGIISYGNSLNGTDSIKYQISSPQNPSFEKIIDSLAFERVNVSLWEMKEGEYDIIIKALAANGLSDGIQHKLTVVNSYFEIETAQTKKLEKGMVITGGNSGMTTLIFTDSSRAKYLPTLYNLRYSGGSRIDQKLVSKIAYSLLEKYYKLDDIGDNIEVSIEDYYKHDGGYGILPYSESDPYLTAKLTPLIINNVDKSRLSSYFYSILYDSNRNEKAPVLYGLAVLKEPVLLELDKYSQVENLKLTDYVFLALAYAELGETPTAEKLYGDYIVPYLEFKEPYARIIKSPDEEEIFSDTAMALLIASKLERNEKDSLYSYLMSTRSDKILISLEKLMFINDELLRLPATEAEFTYSYEGKTYDIKLDNGYSNTMRLPSLKLKDIKIEKVLGDINLVTVFKSPLKNSSKENASLKIDRQYYSLDSNVPKTSFKENEIVKVVITWDIPKNAIDSSYEIYDYVPAGLKPIESPWQIGIRDQYYWWYRDFDGQKVTFNVHKDMMDKNPLVYYVRVTNPGIFKAEAPVIQGNIVKDDINFGEDQIITIK